MDVRTIEQNSRLWALLTIIARSVEWYGKRLTPDEWKDVFTAGLRKQKVVPNLDGDGFVLIGASTRRMTKQEHSDLQDLIEAFASERGVVLDVPKEVA